MMIVLSGLVAYSDISRAVRGLNSFRLESQSGNRRFTPFSRFPFFFRVNLLDKLNSCMYTSLMKVGRDTNGKLVRKAKFKAPPHKAYQSGAEVKIQFGIVKCKFLTPYPKGLYEMMTVMVPGYFFTPSYKKHLWDGKHRFITKAGYFHTGLLSVVYACLKKGANPLDKEGKKNRVKPIDNVTVVVPEKLKKYYHPGLVNYYLEEENILQYLTPETGEFAYPTKLLKNWTTVRDNNPLAKKVLKLAKSLHGSSQ